MRCMPVMLMPCEPSSLPASSCLEQGMASAVRVPVRCASSTGRAVTIQGMPSFSRERRARAKSSPAAKVTTQDSSLSNPPTNSLRRMTVC